MRESLRSLSAMTWTLAIEFPRALVDGERELFDERERGRIDDGVDRVEAERVDVEFGDPI